MRTTDFRAAYRKAAGLKPLDAAVRARAIPHKYMPPAATIIKKPFTFAEGRRYAYVFKTAAGRFFQVLTDELMPITDALDRLKDLLKSRHYKRTVGKLTYHSVIEATK